MNETECEFLEDCLNNTLEKHDSPTIYKVWYEKHDNLIRVAHILNEYLMFDSISNAIYFFEKP